MPMRMPCEIHAARAVAEIRDASVPHPRFPKTQPKNKMNPAMNLGMRKMVLLTASSGSSHVIFVRSSKRVWRKVTL